MSEQEKTILRSSSRQLRVKSGDKEEVTIFFSSEASKKEYLERLRLETKHAPARNRT